jgi:hypothetical protein
MSSYIPKMTPQKSQSRGMILIPVCEIHFPTLSSTMKSAWEQHLTGVIRHNGISSGGNKKGLSGISGEPLSLNIQQAYFTRM